MTVAVDTAAGDPGSADRSVEAFRLAGSNSASEFISGLGGRAGIALGILLFSIIAIPVQSVPAPWLIAATAVFALGAGIVMVRFPSALPLPAMDLLLVFVDGLLVVLGHYPGPLQPALPGVYLVVGNILFAVRRWPVVLAHFALLGASYAGVLAVGPDHFAPVTRWLVVMTVIFTTGVFVRWLVATVAGLAVEEHTARDMAETATFELEQVSRAKSVFLARMSHELRTPLNVVLGFSDLLGEQVVGPLNVRQREYVADIADSARHLVALVDDVLDLAAVEAGGVRLNTGPLDVVRVVEDSVIMVRDRAAAKGLRVTVDVPPTVGVVEADRLKIRQVVVNLLANAVKFTPRGGQVSVRARAVGDVVRIAVEDNGIGVPAEDRERIFEEFAQAKGSAEGTGLGLPLARRFVQLHGGSMWVHSRPGGGSIFQFELPRHVPNAADAVPQEDYPLDSERDYSAFTRPASLANRVLIGRIAYRLILISATLTILLALITPGRFETRILVVGIGVIAAAIAGFRAARISRVSFLQVELFGWGSIIGITVLTAVGGPFADLVPFAYGMVTMISFALWVRSRAISRLVAIAVCYGGVLVIWHPHEAWSHWIAIMTLLGFNGEIVSWVTRRLRRLVVAEQAAHRGARRIRAELAATSRHKSTFVANMSHELRTPLNAVIGFADLLDTGLVGDLNDVQREYIHDIQESARHLLAIINDVLDAAKLDAGQMQLKLDVIPVRALIERAISRGNPPGADHATDVHLEMDSTVDFIVADRQRLEQVLVHLVSNAVKFTPEGGRAVVAARSAPNGELHISVSDSGIGILPDQVDRIFDAFHQGTRLPADHVRAGTGLGLSLAKSLVEMHGGRIWVTSQPDKGSTFTVALPVLMTAMRPLETAQRAES